MIEHLISAEESKMYVQDLLIEAHRKFPGEEIFPPVCMPRFESGIMLREFGVFMWFYTPKHGLNVVSVAVKHV